VEVSKSLNRISAVGVASALVIAVVSVLIRGTDVVGGADSIGVWLWLALGTLSTTALCLLTVVEGRVVTGPPAQRARLGLLVAHLLWVSGLIAVTGGVSQPYYLLYAPRVAARRGVPAARLGRHVRAARDRAGHSGVLVRRRRVALRALEPLRRPPRRSPRSRVSSRSLNTVILEQRAACRPNADDLRSRVSSCRRR
jgi:hypothetical protein